MAAMAATAGSLSFIGSISAKGASSKALVVPHVFISVSS